MYFWQAAVYFSTNSSLIINYDNQFISVVVYIRVLFQKKHMAALLVCYALPIGIMVCLVGMLLKRACATFSVTPSFERPLVMQ